MKFRTTVISVCFLLTLLILPCANASSKPIQKGDAFPDIRMHIPTDPSYQKELGVSGAGDFGVQDIKADVVVILIFHSG